MKTKSMLSILIIGLILAGCGGDSGKTKSQSSSKSSVSSSSSKTDSKSSVSSSSSKTEFTKMLQEYGDIVDDYADVMKKVSAGDMSAMSEIMSFAERQTKWMERWDKKLNSANLSPGDLADIMKEFQNLMNKYQKIASSM